MKPARKNRDRSSVSIIRGIRNKLVIEGQCCPLVQAISVVGFHYLLVPVIEPAITDQDSEASGREVGACLRREPLYHATNSDLIVGAAPRRSLQDCAYRKASVAVSPADLFGLPGVPASA